MNKIRVMAAGLSLLCIPCIHHCKTDADERLVVVAEQEYIETREPAEKASYEVFEPTPDDIREEEYYDSLELLAMVVEAEAGNQDLKGKRLVACVVLNRVDDHSGLWPDTIEEVLYQKYQFVSMWDGAVDRLIEPSEETFEAVRLELKERSDPDIFYFTAGDYGAYGTRCYQYGAHFFSKK